MNDLKKDIQILRGRVRLLLWLKGTTIADLAKNNGIKSSSLCTVFFRAYPRGERIIADALNLKSWEIWPHRYDENHKPNRPNLWYRRKFGAWKPKTKISQASPKSTENLREYDSNEPTDEK